MEALILYTEERAITLDAWGIPYTPIEEYDGLNSAFRFSSGEDEDFAFRLFYEVLFI